MLKRLAIFLAVTASSCAVNAGDSQQHEESHPAEPVLEQLSPGLRQLLVQEMVALQEGMQSLLPALVSGQWEEIAALGEKMRDSYILKQKLTPSQADELHRSLPPAFREIDQDFHHDADMLAHAANNRNRELVTFYFYRMTDACLSCHARFATQRFPRLKPGVVEGYPH